MCKLLQFSGFILLLISFSSCKENSVGTGSDFGTAEVVVTTGGDDKGEDPYVLHIDESTEEEIPTTGREGGVTAADDWSETTSIRLGGGTHEIELTALAPNCTVEGDNPVTVTIRDEQTTEVVFSVVCRAALNNKVVFVSDRDGPMDLYVADPGETQGEGFTNYKRLTRDDFPESHPAISSDGTRIAYARGGNIWVINADGSDPTQLTDSRLDNRPAWISGNTRIAFISEREGIAQIYVMNADGSDQTVFATDLPIHDIRDCDDGEPDRPPSKIAIDSSCDLVVSMGEGEGTDIGWIDLDSDGDGIPHQLTDNDHFDGYPALSPDRSELLIVVGDAEGTKNLRIIDAETGKTLSTSDFVPGFIDDEAYPSWSPDGSEILFTSVNQSSAKLAAPSVKAQDYNAARSNKPTSGIDIDTDRTDFNVMHAVWSPVW